MLAILYQCEASSEHPLAKAIVKKVKNECEGVETDTRFKLDKFKNINGEGVVSTILYQGANPASDDGLTEQKAESLTVLCGNDKLMERHGIDLEFNNFRMNMQSLEKEGKTVVCLVVD